MTRLVAADVCRLSPQSKNEIQPRAADCKTTWRAPCSYFAQLHTHTHAAEGIPRKWRIISSIDRLSSRTSTFPAESES